jgi:hypothetical protein
MNKLKNTLLLLNFFLIKTIISSDNEKTLIKYTLEKIEEHKIGILAIGSIGILYGIHKYIENYQELKNENNIQKELQKIKEESESNNLAIIKKQCREIKVLEKKLEKNSTEKKDQSTQTSCNMVDYATYTGDYRYYYYDNNNIYKKNEMRHEEESDTEEARDDNDNNKNTMIHKEEEISKDKKKNSNLLNIKKSSSLISKKFFTMVTPFM